MVPKFAWVPIPGFLMAEQYALQLVGCKANKWNTLFKSYSYKGYFPFRYLKKRASAGGFGEIFFRIEVINVACPAKGDEFLRLVKPWKTFLVFSRGNAARGSEMKGFLGALHKNSCSSEA